MDVIKLNYAGVEEWRYPIARILQENSLVIVVEAFFARPDMDLGYTTFKQGDRFVEYFFADEWYNIFAIYDRDNQQHKGWYCNICRPARWTAAQIECADLALDLWISPTHEVQLLDEEQFLALPLTAEERQQAKLALEQLLMLNQEESLPL